MDIGFKPKGWDELYKETKNRWAQPNEYAYILKNGLIDTFDKNIRILDIGYGIGRHVLYFLNQGFVVSGFDIAANAEKFSREILSKAIV